MRSTQNKIGVISNPNSGHNRDHFGEISAVIEGNSNISHIVTHSAEAADGALDQLASEGVNVLAINGGDGTNSAILGRMLERNPFPTTPLIVLLPGGTANMNAGDVGIRGSLQKAVARFCDWCEGDHASTAVTTKRALLRVEPENAPPLYTMFIGGGAVIHGTEYAHAEIHSRGLRDDFSLALGTIRTVWGVVRNDPKFNQHVSIDLGLDGAPGERHDTLILAISTLRRLAFGMRPFWSDAPGSIRLTVMDQGCTQFGRTFLSIVRGKPNRNATSGSGYHSFNANQVRLTLTGKLNLDGEILDVDGDINISASSELEFLAL